MSRLIVAQTLLHFCYFSLLVTLTCASIFDYFPLGKSIFGNSDTTNEISNDLTKQKVPYEVEIADERFIEQAAQLTGLSLSDLDKCQHRVILKLQEDCHKLNDEQLAKLAVKLLNCQSSIEGRTIYPCTDKMAIRDCTSAMDKATWNSYLIMSNRARAVCYSIRQSQFRGLTELTVNKLMGAAHDQLDIMSRLKDGQFKIEEATSKAFETIVQSNEDLRKQQQDLQQAQFYGQLALENNIRRLADEKQLILDGHEQLQEMTRDVKEKLDEAAKQLEDQSEERKGNHREILNDLILIQKQAQTIFARIEDSSKHMLEQSALAAKQYELTLAQLAQVNSTVFELVGVVLKTRATLENKLKWMAEALGGTDNAVERLNFFISHIIYLILAMISCSFLQVGVSSRIFLMLLVPLNLLISIRQGAGEALTFLNITLALLTFIIAQILFNYTLNVYKKYSLNAEKKEAIQDNVEMEEKEMIVEEEIDYVSPMMFNRTVLNHRTPRSPLFAPDTPDNYSDVGFDEFVSPTPPLSRNGYTRSRSKTPLLNGSGSEKRKCRAKTRMGSACKNSASIGRDFCVRHQTGSSVIM